MMSEEVKYITDPAILSFYDEDIVKNIIEYYETYVRDIIKSTMELDPEFKSNIERVQRSRRAEAFVNYSNNYDRFMNYTRYLLEKTKTLEGICLHAGTDVDLTICILASYLRKKLR